MPPERQTELDRDNDGDDDWEELTEADWEEYYNTDKDDAGEDPYWDDSEDYLP